MATLRALAEVRPRASSACLTCTVVLRCARAGRCVERAAAAAAAAVFAALPPLRSCNGMLPAPCLHRWRGRCPPPPWHGA